MPALELYANIFGVYVKKSVWFQLIQNHTHLYLYTHKQTHLHKHISIDKCVFFMHLVYSHKLYAFIGLILSGYMDNLWGCFTRLKEFDKVSNKLFIKKKEQQILQP